MDLLNYNDMEKDFEKLMTLTDWRMMSETYPFYVDKYVKRYADA